MRLRSTLKKANEPTLYNEIQTLLSDFEMRRRLRRTSIEQSYRVLAIENTCGLVMTECLDVCSNLGITTQEAAVQLLNYLLPEWKQVVDDFSRLSLADCKAMLIADKEKIIRLEMTDIHDPHGLLYIVRDAVTSKIQFVTERQRIGSSLRFFDQTIVSLIDNLPVSNTDREWLLRRTNSGIDLRESFNNPFRGIAMNILGRNLETNTAATPSFFSYNSQT